MITNEHVIERFSSVDHLLRAVSVLQHEIMIQIQVVDTAGQLNVASELGLVQLEIAA